MQRSGNRRRRRRRRARLLRRYIRRIFALLLFAVALYCAFYLGRHYLMEYRTRRTNDSLKDLYGGAQENADAAQPSATGAPLSNPAPTEAALLPEPDAAMTEPPAETAPEALPDLSWASPVLADDTLAWQYAAMPVAQDAAKPQVTLPPLQASFAALMEQNGDVCGWLRMGDQIDLPVVRRDNQYYLDHDFYGANSAAGTLFLDARNALWPEDQNRILYGHNMKDGTMFGTLNYYRKLENVQNCPVVTYNTIFEDAQYVPFAYFDASMEKDTPAYFDLLRFNFEGAEDFSAFVAEVRQRSLYEIPVDVAPGDELITLCTCSYSLDDGRFMVICRKLRPGETEQDVAALVRQSREK